MKIIETFYSYLLWSMMDGCIHDRGTDSCELAKGSSLSPVTGPRSWWWWWWWWWWCSPEIPPGVPVSWWWWWCRPNMRPAVVAFRWWLPGVAYSLRPHAATGSSSPPPPPPTTPLPPTTLPLPTLPTTTPPPPPPPPSVPNVDCHGAATAASASPPVAPPVQ